MSHKIGQLADGGIIESREVKSTGFDIAQKAINGGSIKTDSLVAIASPDPEIFNLLVKLRAVPEVQSNHTLIISIDSLKTELQKTEPNLAVVQSLWSVVQGSATVSGAIGFVEKLIKYLVSKTF